MKKSILFSATVLFFLASPASVLALDIKIQPSGAIHLYSNTVLGETTSPTAGNSAEPNKIIPAYQQQELRMKANPGLLQVQQQNRNSNSQVQPTVIDQAPRVNLEYPASDTPQQDRLQLQEQAEVRVQPNQSYLKTLEAERQERKNEALEVRSRYDEQNRPQLELRSEGVAAQLRGAEFSYDQATNEVKVITPSGQEHILYHLPDQALSRLKTGIASELADQLDSTELEVQTTADGRVLYKAKLQETKRLFGLLPRTITKEATLDDSSGQVTTEELLPTDALGKLLYTLSM